MSVPYDPDDSAIIDRFYEREYDFWHEAFQEHPEVYNDRMAQAVFHEAFFEFTYDNDQREALQGYLEDYLWDEYEVDFSELFDWEGYREWYG